MEIKQYFYLLRKWLWLLLLGACLGGLSGFVFSLYQTRIYEATTRVLVSRAFQDNASSSISSDLQLAKTYVELFITEPTLKLLNEKLGFIVDPKTIEVVQIPGSLLIELKVQHENPEIAADIANTLVTVFIDYYDSLQSSRYETSEQSLQTQISDIETQITRLQTDLEQVTEDVEASKEQETEKRIQEIKIELEKIEPEIVNLQSQMNALVPRTLITDTQVITGSVTSPSILHNLILLLPQGEQKKYLELEMRLDELKRLRDSYNETYTNLLVNGAQEQDDEKWIARKDQIEKTLAQYQQIHSDLLNSYENIRLARLNNTPNIAQVEPAPIPAKPLQPRPLRNAALGAAVGLIIMSMVALLIEYLDDTIKTPEDVQRLLNLPVIGLIGGTLQGKGSKKNRDLEVVVAENPLSPVTEAFRTLRANIEFANVDKALKTLLITSPSPVEGKSTVSVNLAVVMSQEEKKIVLIDSDLRRPSIHRYLKLPNRKGLSDIFRNQSRLSNVMQAWGNPTFSVITSGEILPNPSELLASSGMGRVINELEERFDVVIIDSPPAVVIDPIVLSAKVDGVVIVIEPGKTRIGAAQLMLEQLQRAGARVLGVVMNPISQNHTQYYSKYPDSSYFHESPGYGIAYSETNLNKRIPKERQKLEDWEDRPAN